MIDILILEPDKVLGETYKKALQAAGYKVACHPTAQAAIHSVDKQNPKLIICELLLFENNGVEFLYELRSHADWQNIPVVVLSSLVTEESGMTEAVKQQLNVHKYCYKPETSLKSLIKIVNEVFA